MRTNLKLPCSIFELAHIKLEKEGIYEWFDRDYYWCKWLEYVEKIREHLDNIEENKEKTQFKKVL